MLEMRLNTTALGRDLVPWTRHVPLLEGPLEIVLFPLIEIHC
jgi:hypothetical protein